MRVGILFSAASEEPRSFLFLLLLFWFLVFSLSAMGEKDNKKYPTTQRRRFVLNYIFCFW